MTYSTRFARAELKVAFPGSLAPLYASAVTMTFFGVRLSIISSTYVNFIDNGIVLAFFRSEIVATQYALTVKQGTHSCTNTKFEGVGVSLHAESVGNTSSSKINFFDDSELSLVNSRISLVGPSLFSVISSTVSISSSNMTMNGPGFMLFGKSNVTVNSELPLIFTNGAFLALFNGSRVAFAGNSLQLSLTNQASMTLTGGSQAAFDGQSVPLTRGGAIIVTESSLVNITRGKVFGDASSTLSCGDSTFIADEVDASFQIDFRGCNFTCNGGFVLRNDTQLARIRSSRIQIIGDAFASANSSFGAIAGSSVAIAGNLELNSARLFLAYSHLEVRGGLTASNCIAPSTANVLGLNLADHTSCLVILYFSSVDVSGDLNLPRNSTFALSASQIELGGVAFLGSGSFFVLLEESSLETSGQLTLEDALFVVRNSNLVVDTGSMLIRNNTSAYLSNATSEIRRGHVKLQSCSVLSMEGGSLSLSGGDLVLEPITSPSDTTLAGLFKNLIPAFYLSDGASVHVTGGSVLLKEWNLIDMQRSSIRISSGNVSIANWSAMNVQNQSSLSIEGGFLRLEGGLIVAQTNSSIFISGGNIELMRSSFFSLTGQSQVKLKGSVILSQSSVMRLNGSSLLDVDGGSIILDSSSSVTIDQNSTIRGVGSVSGTVTILGGKISYQAQTGAQATNLTITTLQQSNTSSFEAVLASSFGPAGTSTQVFAQNITLGGSLTVVIDDSMLQRLINGEQVVLMSSETDLVGNYSSIQVSTSSAYACAARVQSLQKTLVVVFDLSQCPSPAPGGAGGSPSLAADIVGVGGINVGLAVGISIAVFVVVAVAVVVIVMYVRKLRSRVMPWRNSYRREEAEAVEFESHAHKPTESPAADEIDNSAWQRTAPTQ